MASISPLNQIHALLLVQYRSFVKTLRGQGRGLRLSASIVFSVLWYGLWMAAATGAFLIPNLIGREDVETALGGILLFAMGYWQLAPLMTLSLGVSLEMSKVMIYPVSIYSLFGVECLLRVVTGFEILLLLTGLFGGLAWAGSPYLAELALAFVLFVAFNVFLSAGVRNLVERLFQRRRLREIVLVVLVSCTILPQLLIWNKGARTAFRSVLRSTRGIPDWMHPSGLAARVSIGEGVVWDWILLAAMVGAAAIFGFVQFVAGCRRGVGAASSAPPKSKSVGGRLLLVLSRWVADPIAALVEKEIRYLWRSPRFRLPFFMGFTFGVAAWVPIMRHWQDTVGAWMEHSAVTLISLYAFLLLGPVMFLNRFGFDRQSTQFYFWLPLGFRDLLIAKNLATLFFAGLELALVALACRLIGLAIGFQQILEAALIGMIAMLYLLSVGNHMSVRFPVASNPDRVSRAGMGNGLRAAIQFTLFPLSLAPIAAAIASRYYWGGDEGFAGALAIAALAGAGLYLFTLTRSAAYGERFREPFLSHLTEGGGSLAGE